MSEPCTLVLGVVALFMMMTNSEWLCRCAKREGEGASKGCKKGEGYTANWRCGVAGALFYGENCEKLFRITVGEWLFLCFSVYCGNLGHREYMIGQSE